MLKIWDCGYLILVNFANKRCFTVYVYSTTPIFVFLDRITIYKKCQYINVLEYTEKLPSDVIETRCLQYYYLINESCAGLKIFNSVAISPSVFDKNVNINVNPFLMTEQSPKRHTIPNHIPYQTIPYHVKYQEQYILYIAEVKQCNYLQHIHGSWVTRSLPYSRLGPG